MINNLLNSEFLQFLQNQLINKKFNSKILFIEKLEVLIFINYIVIMIILDYLNYIILIIY